MEHNALWIINRSIVKKKIKEKCLEKGRPNYEENKELQKIAPYWY